MNTLATVEQVLRESDGPLNVKQIVQRAGARLPSKSKTPDTVVARDLSVNIKRLGEASIFVRTAPGLYTLREKLQPAAPPISLVGSSLRNEAFDAIGARPRSAAPSDSLHAGPRFANASDRRDSEVDLG